MASKTLTITEDVYQLLKQVKHPDESFSDLLRRLLHNVNGQQLESFFGAWDMDEQEYNSISHEIALNVKGFKPQKVKLD